MCSGRKETCSEYLTKNRTKFGHSIYVFSAAPSRLRLDHLMKSTLYFYIHLFSQFFRDTRAIVTTTYEIFSQNTRGTRYQC